MGTSGSSSGPRSRIPIVPTWVSDPGEIGDVGQSPVDHLEIPPAGERELTSHSVTEPVSQSGRFRATRLSFGQFAKSGGTHNLRKGLREYVSSGYGGSAVASKRLTGTGRTATRIFGTLSALASNAELLSRTKLDPSVLRSRSARQVIGEIVEAIRPTDGTQDAEASRKAMTDAFSELLERYPEADLLQLADDQRLDVTEFFIGNDIFYRVWLDVGKSFQDRSPSAELAFQRMVELQQYIKSEVSRVFSMERAKNRQFSVATVQLLVRKVIDKTVDIFGNYDA